MTGTQHVCVCVIICISASSQPIVYELVNKATLDTRGWTQPPPDTGTLKHSFTMSLFGAFKSGTLRKVQNAPL
jgi:hypothetical protein